MRNDAMTYAKAGVDAAQISVAHKILSKKLEPTFSTRKGRIGRPLVSIGHYAGLVDLNDGRLLGLHTDGVGTKAMIAKMMKTYDTIGIDCVAMCVNDLICTGCEPFAFLDYIAIDRPDQFIIERLGEGVAKGAKEAGVAVVGGETAIIPDMLAKQHGGGLDLVGMAVGICRKKDLVLGDDVQEEDVIIGLESSGIHANGLTFARKVLLENHRLREKIPQLGCSLGEELLKPTAIYVKAVVEALHKTEIHGLAHITSTSFSKIKRVISRVNLSAVIDQMPVLPKIFELIQTEGGVSDIEMYRAFNMGIGMVIICPPVETDSIFRIAKRHHHEPHVLGRIKKGKGVTVMGMRLA